jgi:hypothetical protein
MLLRWAAAVKRDSRGSMDYLTLVAVVVFVFNTLHARPNEMHWDRTLSIIVFPHTTLKKDPTLHDRSLRTPRNKHDDVAYMSHGAIWLPLIVYPVDGQGDVLRFKFLRTTATEDLIGKLFNMKWDAIQQMFCPEYLKAPVQGLGARKRTTASDEPIARKIILPAGVQDFRYKKDRHYFDHAPDLPPTAHVGVSPPLKVRRSASEFFVGLLMQVMQRMPKIGSTPLGYCNLLPGQVLAVSVGTFQDLNLSTYYSSFQYIRGDREWAATKTMLFPGVNNTPVDLKKAQGWKLVPLFVEFLALRAEGGAPFEKLRNFCLVMFDKLKWFPHLDRLRFVDTLAKATYRQIFPGTQKRGVPIDLNPAFTGKPTSEKNVPPVLDRLLSNNEDADLRRDRQQHELALPPLAQAVFGFTRDPNSDDEEMPEGLQAPTEDTIAWVQARVGKKNGRQVIGNFYRPPSPMSVDEDDDEEQENEVMNELLG